MVLVDYIRIFFYKFTDFCHHTVEDKQTDKNWNKKKKIQISKPTNLCNFNNRTHNIVSLQGLIFSHT